MTVEKFLRSLPRDPVAALGQIEGAISFDGIGAKLSTEERSALVVARLGLQKSAPKKKGRRT